MSLASQRPKRFFLSQLSPIEKVESDTTLRFRSRALLSDTFGGVL